MRAPAISEGPTRPAGSALLAGAGLPGTSGAAPAPTGVLEARGITKSYRRGLPGHRRTISALREVDLTLFLGEVMGLVGENGSGKSTLLRILVGADRADVGTVEVDGWIGYCPQAPALYGRLTSVEHFELFGAVYAMTDAEVGASVEMPEATDRFVPAVPRPGPEPCAVPEVPDPVGYKYSSTRLACTVADVTFRSRTLGEASSVVVTR